jgi:uncharacterized protein YjiS (DUF1127 family)
MTPEIRLASRQRYHLSLLDEHLLRDIGVSRAQAQSEVDKPFWL